MDEKRPLITRSRGHLTLVMRNGQGAPLLDHLGSLRPILHSRAHSCSPKSALTFKGPLFCSNMNHVLLGVASILG